MPQTKKPKYYDLMEDLRRQITAGRLKPGDKLPSENELSAQYQVSRQTVRKALEILEDEGLTYAEHGRGTFVTESNRHSKVSRNIAVITTYLSDYIFPRVIQGVDQVLTDSGYSIILKNTKNSRSQEAKILEELLDKDIDGLIIEPSKSQIFCRHTNLYEMLDSYHIPYVFIQGSYAQMKDKPHILMDDCKGGFLVTDYLISLGRRNLVGIFKADDYQGQERHKGYVQALQKAGIPYDPDRVIWYHTEDRKLHPYVKLKQLIEAGRGRTDDSAQAASIQLPFDGVVAYNDQIAIDVIKALEEEGLSCPEDVSVTGYDDSYLAASCRIPLTTITHPQEELGIMAAKLLMKLINEETIPESEKQILIQPELVVRASCTHKK